MEQALAELRHDASLNEKERVALEELEPILFMPLGRFSEAREALSRMRAAPSLPPEKLKRIEFWEGILAKWEAGKIAKDKAGDSSSRGAK